ncbi:MAG: CHRD domain-containing protein [Phycisphaerales bacterium]|nr:CHRD domain-containing protein [Phycisphaerales bacterium]
MKTRIAISALASVAMATSTMAATHVFNFPLEGTQEVPPNASPGSGSATVTLDDVTGAVSVNATFTGLIGNATASHIHGPAAPGVNAGVLVTLSPTVGATSGTITGSGTLTAPQITDMLNGLHYINLHSTSFGGGELRGQVVNAVGAIPTVSEWGMIVLGLVTLTGGTLLIRRRVAQPALAV